MAQVDTAPFFVAIMIPEQVHATLDVSLQRFREHVRYIVPSERRHITLAYLGKTNQSDRSFTDTISMPFVPMASITHIGLGGSRDQLWAYVHATPLIHELRAAVGERLIALNLPPQDEERAFIPHIKLANIKDGGAAAIADAATPITFPIRNVSFLRSRQDPSGTRYEQIATARITA